MNSRAEFRYHVTELGEKIARMQYYTITKRMVHERLEQMKFEK